MVQLSSGMTSLSYGPVSLQTSEERAVTSEEYGQNRSNVDHKVDMTKIGSAALDSLFPNDKGLWRTNTSLHRPPYDQVIEFICNVEMNGNGLCGFPNNTNADLPFSATTLRIGIERKKSRLELVPLEYLTDDVCTSTPLSEAELEEEYYLNLP